MSQTLPGAAVQTLIAFASTAHLSFEGEWRSSLCALMRSSRAYRAACLQGAGTLRHFPSLVILSGMPHPSTLSAYFEWARDAVVSGEIELDLEMISTLPVKMVGKASPILGMWRALRLGGWGGEHMLGSSPCYPKHRNAQGACRIEVDSLQGKCLTAHLHSDRTQLRFAPNVELDLQLLNELIESKKAIMVYGFLLDPEPLGARGRCVVMVPSFNSDGDLVCQCVSRNSDGGLVCAPVERWALHNYELLEIAPFAWKFDPQGFDGSEFTAVFKVVVGPEDDIFDCLQQQPFSNCALWAGCPIPAINTAENGLSVVSDAQLEVVAGMDPVATETENELPVVRDVQLEGQAALEPIAHIHPEEARVISTERWASSIELLASGGAMNQQLPSSEREVCIMQFNKDPPALDQVLLASDLADRKRCQGIDLKPAWAMGAKMFVKICQEDLADIGIELRPRHVIVLADDIAEIEGLVSTLPSHSRPRLKPSAGIIDLPLAGDTTRFGTSTVLGSPRSADVGSNHVSGTTSSSEAFLPPPPIKFTFLHYDIPENGDEEDKLTSRSV